MYKINDKVVYKKDVCLISDIRDINGLSYYVLIPVNDESLKISVPITSNSVREVLTKKKSEELIKKIKEIEPLEEEGPLDYTFRELINEGSYESLIKIIKTIYNRNKLGKKKKLSDRENTYYKEAEKYLYTELGTALKMTVKDTKKYIISTLEDNDKDEK